MARTIMGAVVSLDGYLAKLNGEIGPLFEWYDNGDVEWRFSEKQEEFARTTMASKEFMEAVYTDIGAVVIGRRLFDETNGWGGVPAAGDRVFVVTHSVPRNWEFAATAPFTFVTDGVESAIEQAKEFTGDGQVDVAAGQVGGQALRLGLIDQVVMNVVPVVFGAGRPFFAAMGPGEDILFSNPTRVAQGDRVTHLLYDVRRN
ncbi:dihydrofolate reductase family protein [Saccharothrix sp. AJ9571]|nr:dihydrofolate reductase family protein [Saccharothrix sp. AJ9571]